MLKSLHTLSLILPLLAPCAIRAEVKISLACRVKNRPPGRCGWCALETLARHLGLPAMYGLTEKHPSLCSPDSLEECLRNADISYRIQYPGRLREEILRYAIQADLGAAVGLRGPYPGADKHIVTLVDFDDDSVKLIDSNDGGGRIRQMSLSRFRRCWDGFALVLEPGTVWAQRNVGGGEPDATRRPIYGSFTPPEESLCPPRLRFWEALSSQLPKTERDDSPFDPRRRSRRAWPSGTTFSRIPTTMRRGFIYADWLDETNDPRGLALSRKRLTIAILRDV